MKLQAFQDFQSSEQTMLRATYLVLEIPHAVLVCELFMHGATLGQDATLKATHVEQQIRVVFAVDRHEAVLPVDGCHRAWQSVLDVPEHSPAAASQKQSIKFTPATFVA